MGMKIKNIKNKKAAFKESLVDSFLGLPLNFLISYLLLFFFVKSGVNDIIYFSVGQSILLLFFSVLRKFIIRIKFSSDN